MIMKTKKRIKEEKKKKIERDEKQRAQNKLIKEKREKEG